MSGNLFSIFCRHDWEYVCWYKQSGIYTVVYKCSKCKKAIKEPPRALKEKKCNHCFLSRSVNQEMVEWECCRCGHTVKTNLLQKPVGNPVRILENASTAKNFTPRTLPGFARSRNYTTV